MTFRENYERSICTLLADKSFITAFDDFILAWEYEQDMNESQTEC